MSTTKSSSILKVEDLSFKLAKSEREGEEDVEGQNQIFDSLCCICLPCKS